MKKKAVKRISLKYSCICWECAEKKGAESIPGHCYTSWKGKCPYCKKEKSMMGTNDCRWPDTGKPRGMWD